jgi:FMN phosphatase YigB (HAD superfamily)
MGQIKTVLFDLGNVLAFVDFNEFWAHSGFCIQKKLHRLQMDINRGHTCMKLDLHQRVNT